MIQNLAYRLLVHAPAGVVRRLANRKLVLPYYHLVSDDDLPHAKHLYRYRNVRQFRADLDFFLSHFTPIGLPELLAALREGRPFTRESFLLSFDDGNRELHDVVAPILKEKGVPATFFLVTEFLDNQQLGHLCKRSLIEEALEHRDPAPPPFLSALQAHGLNGPDPVTALRKLRYDQRAVLDELAAILEVDFEEYRARRQPFLTSAQVRALVADGFTIGAHTLDHPVLGWLSLPEQLHQTAASVGFIRERFGLDYAVFAFPHHDEGISKTWFTEVYRRGLLDASFGSAGMLRDVHPRHCQRLAMEHRATPAADRLFEVSVEHVVNRWQHRDQIQRWG